MPWKLQLHPACPADPKPGDVWPAPHLVGHDSHWRKLSPKYHAQHASKRAPLIVRLPGGAGDFCLDQLAWNESGPHGEGWDVVGEAPALTVTPSINIAGYFHGWICDGVLTDDCEGRTYPKCMGELIAESAAKR